MRRAVLPRGYFCLLLTNHINVIDKKYGAYLFASGAL
jgi:hypothetical protein